MGSKSLKEEVAEEWYRREGILPDEFSTPMEIMLAVLDRRLKELQQPAGRKESAMPVLKPGDVIRTQGYAYMVKARREGYACLWSAITLTEGDFLDAFEDIDVPELYIREVFRGGKSIWQKETP